MTSQLATHVEKMEIPQKRFSHVYLDLVGPSPCHVQTPLSANSHRSQYQVV